MPEYTSIQAACFVKDFATVLGMARALGVTTHFIDDTPPVGEIDCSFRIVFEFHGTLIEEISHPVLSEVLAKAQDFLQQLKTGSVG